VSKAEILDVLPTLRPDERQAMLDRLCAAGRRIAVGLSEMGEGQRPGSPGNGNELGRGFEEGIGPSGLIEILRIKQGMMDPPQLFGRKPLAE
jgi:hypothetical protein